MCTLYRYLLVLIVIAHCMTACSPRTVQAQQTIPKLHKFRDMLGKPANDREIDDLLAGSPCIKAAPFQICKDAGLAFWLDSDGNVRSVYLYLNEANGFDAYSGELPFGLKFYDTLGAVEYKLSHKGVGNAGLPDEAASADHTHYWAIYKKAGITIIYNSPFADEDATIYAIVLNG